MFSPPHSHTCSSTRSPTAPSIRRLPRILRLFLARTCFAARLWPSLASLTSVKGPLLATKIGPSSSVTAACRCSCLFLCLFVGESLLIYGPLAELVLSRLFLWTLCFFFLLRLFSFLSTFQYFPQYFNIPAPTISCFGTIFAQYKHPR